MNFDWDLNKCFVILYPSYLIIGLVKIVEITNTMLQTFYLREVEMTTFWTKKKQNPKFKQIQISAEAYVLNFTYILVVLQFQEERISPVL